MKAGARGLDGVALSLAARIRAGAGGMERMGSTHTRGGGNPQAARDELAAPGSNSQSFSIFDSGSFGIAGVIQSWGGKSKQNRLAVGKGGFGAIARCGTKQALHREAFAGGLMEARRRRPDHARPAWMQLGMKLCRSKKIAVAGPGSPTWFGAGPSKGFGVGSPAIPPPTAGLCRVFLRPLIVEAMLGP